MTRVALLWHMHQPYYEDLVTREHILPWVRLHALKDYYGMVALLEEFPRMRATFNLVPSLLVQLEAFAEDRANDRYFELGMKPAEALTREEIVFVLQNFFHAQQQRMIEVYPRYAELLLLRGGSKPSDIDAAVRRFSVTDLRDLQVWQKLAWFDPYYLDGDARVRQLIAKGAHFSEDDKALLRAVELELLNAVIPAYRARAAAEQIEISTSPFYHPILPLLCDTDIYRRTHPTSRMPRERFIRPEDALAQLERAADCHARLFGRRPVGLWPSEGSVSDAMIPLAAQAGFTWMATDELILARSLGTTFARDEAGHLERPEQLYAPYRVEAGSGQIACGFRDHALSDRIGFVYAGWAAAAAADDFVARIVEGGRRAATAGDADPTVFVILDGENAWEHFEGGGRPFLRALYQGLSSHPELQTVTMSEACREPSRHLRGIFPGSWIDANFYIWIGHQDDQRAWGQLADARKTLETAVCDPVTLSRAREEILIAEGSDWFWWYGDDHSSDHDQEFDDLFRRHLRNVYRLLDTPIPEELFVTNISSGSLGPEQIDPTILLRPTLDGEETSYFEWLGAGSVTIRQTAGAMHQSERKAPVVTGIQFGFSPTHLYVRLDASRPMALLGEHHHTFSLVFLVPDDVRYSISPAGGPPLVARWVKNGASGWTPAATDCRAVVGEILEFSLPVAELGLRPLDRLSFFVTAADASGREMERHPGPRPIEAAVPDERFHSANWSA